MGFSVVRWGGLLAVLGGLILATSGLFMAWWTILRDDWYNVVDFGTLVGGLFLIGAPISLIALIAGQGNSNIHPVRQSRVSNIRGLTWTQRSAVAGFLLAILSIPSTIAIITAVLRYELFPGGYELPLSASVLTVIFAVFGVLSGLGLPVATILLGIAVWSSGFLGRWRALPVIVGVLSILAPLSGIGVSHLTLDSASVGSNLSVLLEVVVPNTVVGLAWALLGFVLLKHERFGERSGLSASTG